MKTPFLLLLLLAAIFGSLRAVGSPLEDRVAELKHAMQKEAEAKVGDPTVPGNGLRNPGLNPAYIAANLDQIVAQMENPAFGGNVDAQLTQLTSIFTSEEVQAASKRLLEEIHQERKARADAEAVTLQALLDRAGKQVTAAKKAEDLDGLIEDLEKPPGTRYGGDGANPNQALYQQISAALEFVKHWQDYLFHFSHGETDKAMQDLLALSQNTNLPSLIPRSTLLTLESPPKSDASSPSSAAASPTTSASEFEATLDGIKTLDDLKPALPALERLRPQIAPDIFFPAYTDVLQMARNYEKLKAGLPAQVNLDGGNQNGPSAPAALRMQLYLLALQVQLNSYKGPPPAPGEKPLDYISRVMVDAITREDWGLLRDAADARSHLIAPTMPGLRPPPNAIDSLVIATHQNDAGQYALAVVSYEEVLKSSDPGVPAKFIGEQLAAIQRDHPQEYAEGMQSAGTAADSSPALPAKTFNRPTVPAVPFTTNLPTPSAPGRPFGEAPDVPATSPAPAVTPPTK